MQTEPACNVQRPEWWKLIATIGINLCCLLMFPLCICGCHFHASAVVPTIIPAAWSIYLVMSYRTRIGQIGAWVAFLIAVFWIWVGFEGNIKFVLRR